MFYHLPVQANLQFACREYKNFEFETKIIFFRIKNADTQCCRL